MYPPEHAGVVTGPVFRVRSEGETTVIMDELDSGGRRRGWKRDDGLTDD